MFLACTGILITEVATFRKAMVQDLSATAEMVGINSSAALMFEDKDFATQILSSLKAQPNIIYAQLYDAENNVFSNYTIDTEDENISVSMPDLEVPGAFQGQRSLGFVYPIELDKEHVGTLYIVSDLSKIDQAYYRLFSITILVFIVSSIIGLLIVSRLQRVISQPLANLAEAARLVRDEDDYSVRAEIDTRDELGALVDGFNTMLDRIEVSNQEISESNQELQQEISERKDAEKKLKDTHKKLLDTSRLAGMAEVATGILHNVGNTLTSVNVSATLIGDKLRKSDTRHLKQLNALIQENIDNLPEFFAKDPKGQKIPDFLDNLAKVVEKEQTLFKDEIDNLRKNINHIRDVIETQQNYSKVVGVRERISAVDLMEHALFLSDDDIIKNSIRIIKDFDYTGEITMERHKVLQILVNLVRNAIQATKINRPHDREIILYIQTKAENMVEFQVNDNGVGISKVHLNRIFQHGFTTKRSGHGFGLHSSALFAKEMGGKLTAYSEGLGQGASFILTLPIMAEQSSGVSK